VGSFGRRRPARSRAPEPDDAGRDTAQDPPADPVSAARTVCLNLLTTRARTRSELSGDLTRRGFDDDVIRGVLDRLVEVGLVDDADFAEQWVTSRHRHQGLGRRALADELRRKGVDQETAGVALAEIDRDDEWARAGELVARRMPSMARLETAVAARRLVGMLARKGYAAGLAHDVVREALAVRDAGVEELLGAPVDVED
jgi:regulatory protein